jgi:tRNA threonylcarbamoyladenosine biosynthesis protein TsaB
VTITLAIATATPQVGVALGNEDGVVASLHLRQGRRHGELLACAIESLTELAGVDLGQVDQIAVDTGPGLFTGLRVGVATAKALASALDLPVVACSSLDILAHAHRHAGERVASVVDARRGEVFWARYRPAGTGAPLMLGETEPEVSDPARLATLLGSVTAVTAEAEGERLLVCGDGARRYAALLAPHRGLVITGPEYDHPSAEVLVDLAASRAALSADKIAPTYIRGPDVRIGWEQRDE